MIKTSDSIWFFEDKMSPIAGLTFSLLWLFVLIRRDVEGVKFYMNKTITLFLGLVIM